MSGLANAPRSPYKRKLIEVAIPLEDINRESAREKSIRYGHPSTLHLWWARRPLATCRAVLFAQLVDDPSEHADEFPTEADQEVERKRLHGIISELVKWENIHKEELIEAAQAEIWKSCNGNPPPILDPFAGGGSIPLEAQRLGLKACARDLNPVAVLINKALIEIPPMFAGRSPVFPGAAKSRISWPGASGLAEDVRRYGHWMEHEAGKRIGHLYPEGELPDGTRARVIAWIWARTVTCPNPACAGTMPLVRSFWLGKKKGRERYLHPVPNGRRVCFEIRGPHGVPREGTVRRTGATCLICSTPVPLAYIRAEGQAGRMGAQLMAIATEGAKQRFYLPANEYHERAASLAGPDRAPDSEIPYNSRYLTASNYGMRTWADLFTNRQLSTLIMFSDLVCEAHERVIADGAEAGYGDAITTYLSLALSRIASTNSSLCRWRPDATKESVNDTFSRQALPMVWDFAEGCPFTQGPSSYSWSTLWVARALDHLRSAVLPGAAQQEDAAIGTYNGWLLVATDPPYYDNISYASISDFFYIWLRRSLASVYPDIMGTVLTPKDDEIVADPARHDGSRAAAHDFYVTQFKKVFECIRGGTPEDFPISFFYAYKQSETKNTDKHQRANGNATAPTAWEALLARIIEAGWTITATWPIQTEMSNRPRGQNSNALNTSVVLACRPRTAIPLTTDLRGFIAELRERLEKHVRIIQQSEISPVDFQHAALGPGVEIFSQYANIYRADGSKVQIGSGLRLINRVLDEVLFQQEGDFSNETRWCVEWFKRHKFNSGSFDEADGLSKTRNTAITRLVRAGVARSGGNNVRLLSPQEIPRHYDVSKDSRVSEWKICLYLAKKLHEEGSQAAVQLMSAAHDKVDVAAVKELTFLVYSIADRKGWAQTAQLFNGVGSYWSYLESESRDLRS
jgi:putative DNA methylase